MKYNEEESESESDHFSEYNDGVSNLIQSKYFKVQILAIYCALI